MPFRDAISLFAHICYFACVYLTQQLADCAVSISLLRNSDGGVLLQFGPYRY